MPKTILITGANSGIGKATALYFAEKGWQVAATMRNLNKGRELKDLKNIKIYKLDVTKEVSIKEAVKNVIKDFKQIDVLLNNAGFGVGGAVEDLSRDDLLAQFDVNLFGLLHVTQEVLPHMRKKKSGMIVNVSSVAGKMAFPFIGAYSATKYALEGFSEALFYELRPFDIKVRLIEPGAIKTDFAHGMNWAKKSLEKNSAYYKQVSAWAQNIAHMFDQATPAVEVAKTVWKAVKNGRKDFRYPVGSDAKQMLRSRKFMSDRAFMKMIGKMYR